MGFYFILFLQEKTAEPTIGKQENGMDIIESAPQRQTNNNSLTYVNGAHNNNGDGNLWLSMNYFWLEYPCKLI